MAKRKKRSIVPEKNINSNIFGSRSTQDFEFNIPPSYDVGTTAFENMITWNDSGKTVRKIVVNGEETLINTRRDDPNP